MRPFILTEVVSIRRLIIQSQVHFLIGNEWAMDLLMRLLRLQDNLIKSIWKVKVESLNAAIACTVLTYEAMRQRRS